MRRRSMLALAALISFSPILLFASMMTVILKLFRLLMLIRMMLFMLFDALFTIAIVVVTLTR